MRDVDVPAVGPRQVHVRVHATAINPLAYQIRRGDYPADVPLPAIIGHDVSGVVEETGAEVREFEVGDEVYDTPKIFGGPDSYAEQHVDGSLPHAAGRGRPALLSRGRSRRCSRAAAAPRLSHRQPYVPRPDPLAAWGRHDPAFVPAGALAYRRDLPDAEVHLLDAGHFALETHAREIADLARDFLGRALSGPAVGHPR